MVANNPLTPALISGAGGFPVFWGGLSRLLSQGVRQKAIDFVFVGVLTLLTDRQQ